MIPAISGLVAFVQALPRVLALLGQIGNYLKQKQVQQFLDHLEKSIDEVEAAHTPEEKQNAAKNLVRAIRNFK
jgi:folylpolyglutamate synthase/dihydropteroate synthase